MIFWLVFIIPVVFAQLVLDDAWPVKHSIVQTINSYKGEYECFDEEFYGSVKLLRLSLLIHNPGEHDYHLFEPLVLRALLKHPIAHTVVSEMEIELACIRDNFCPSRKFYGCSGISRECSLRLSEVIKCQWLNITGLVNGPYLLNVTLSDRENNVYDEIETDINLFLLQHVSPHSSTYRVVLSMILGFLVAIFIVVVPIVTSRGSTVYDYVNWS